jgi:hypothetical protein
MLDLGIPKKPIKTEHRGFQLFSIDFLCDIERGTYKVIEVDEAGTVPLVSATLQNQGVVGYNNIAPKYKAPALTYSELGGALYQDKDFNATTTVIILKLKDRWVNWEQKSIYVYLQTILNSNNYRFNYARKATPSRLGDLEVSLPSVWMEAGYYIPQWFFVEMYIKQLQYSKIVFYDEKGNKRKG